MFSLLFRYFSLVIFFPLFKFLFKSFVACRGSQNLFFFEVLTPLTEILVLIIDTPMGALNFFFFILDPPMGALKFFWGSHLG